MKNFDWNLDLIGEVEGLLSTAQRLWDIQVFVKPTQKRREGILKLLNKAAVELETIIAELEE